MDWGSLLGQGKELLDKAGGSDGIKKQWDKAKDSDTANNIGNWADVKIMLNKVENILEDDVKTSDINISADSSSNMGKFLQTALNKMGHNIDEDGKAGKGTVAALNTALMDKVEAINFLNFDKLKDVKEIDDISQLTGRHVQVLVDELRSRDILGSDKPEMLVTFGEALRDIDNDKLQKIADEFDPEGAKAPVIEVEQSSLDTALPTGMPLKA